MRPVLNDDPVPVGHQNAADIGTHLSLHDHVHLQRWWGVLVMSPIGDRKSVV